MVIPPATHFSSIMIRGLAAVCLLAIVAQAFPNHQHAAATARVLKDRSNTVLRVTRVPASTAGVVIYSTARCPSCKKAKATLDGLGAKYTEVQLDKVEEGAEVRAELKKRTGRTSVPSIWIKGQFVGGMNDGGPAGGLSGLSKGDMLLPMLQKAGAVQKSALDRSPLAPLRGNNLRDALGAVSGATGKMRVDNKTPGKPESKAKKNFFW